MPDLFFAFMQAALIRYWYNNMKNFLSENIKKNTLCYSYAERGLRVIFSNIRGRLQCPNPVKYSNQMLLENDL